MSRHTAPLDTDNEGELTICISKQGFRYWVWGVGLCNAAYPIPNTQHLR